MFVLFNTNLKAQSIVVKPANDNPIKNRFYTGGNFSLAFGSVTFIDISPLVGYKITEEWHVGTGASYMYLKYNDYLYGINIYGGRIFTSYYILENLFLHVEEEWLSLGTDNEESKIDRIDIYSTLVGGGYSQRMGSSSAFNILILYNLNETELSPYPNPVIRMGFVAGL